MVTMVSLIRTLSFGLVVIAVNLHTTAAQHTARYPLTQQAGGLESTLNDDEITLVQPVWGSGPGCDTGAIVIDLSTTHPVLDNADATLTFTDSMSFFIWVFYTREAPVITYEPSFTPPGPFLSVNIITGGFEVLTPSDIVSTGNIGLATSRWYHIGFTFYNKIMKLYVDANERKSMSGVAINTSGNEITFGKYEYVGKMACAYFSDEVVFDIGSLYEEGCPCETITTTTTTTTPPPPDCEDCYCYVDNCYDVGFEYCHDKQCSNCDADHCCCCEKDMDKCSDKPCNCIDAQHMCSDLDMDYCEPSGCEGHCQGAQCCCTKEVQCPVWSECHCMVQKCSEVANFHDCDRCCNDCQFGHCCCCDKDWPVCPKDSECHCEGRSCDKIAGYGYCDPSKCTMASDGPMNNVFGWEWPNYVCPSDQCCCKMDTGTCGDGLLCTCEVQTCWQLGYGYCDCEDVPGCKREHCCCPHQVQQSDCIDVPSCECVPSGNCESLGMPYCNPDVCGLQCAPERCCCPFLP